MPTQIDILVTQVKNAVNGTVLVDKIEGDKYIFVYPTEISEIENIKTELVNEQPLEYVDEYSDLDSYLAFKPI